MSTRVAPRPGRFYLLDSLRGLAALAIVFGHWQHFFYNGTVGADFLPERLPWSSWLLPLYAEGHRAVDLFFSVSGFVFFWLYAQRIAERRVSWREFWVLRFSRLYPLHLLTLIVIGISQYFIRQHTGQYLVYPNNDWLHFLLQLGFASNWFGGDASFNGPVWSVSVEILLYAFFFAACFCRLKTLPALLIFVFLGYLTKEHWLVSRGIFGFFLGGVVYLLYATIIARSNVRTASWWIGLTCVLAWLLAVANYHDHWLEQWASAWGQTASHYASKMTQDVFAGVLFPLTVLTLALLEPLCSRWSHRWSFLGDLSYSSYLLHFPLQMLFILLATQGLLPRSVFSSPISLLIFFPCLIGLSLAVHHYFERPAQQFIRQRLKPAGAS
jgi:peptidoglycan/LPS O-acetylase OafA/YrhL